MQVDLHACAGRLFRRIAQIIRSGFKQGIGHEIARPLFDPHRERELFTQDDRALKGNVPQADGLPLKQLPVQLAHEFDMERPRQNDHVVKAVAGQVGEGLEPDAILRQPATRRFSRRGRDRNNRLRCGCRQPGIVFGWQSRVSHDGTASGQPASGGETRGLRCVPLSVNGRIFRAWFGRTG